MALIPRIGKLPTVTRLLSGSGTFIVPSGAKYLKVRMVGAGGGGGGEVDGSPGTASTFGTMTAGGGYGGASYSVGGGPFGGYGGGGGSGAYCEKIIRNPASSYPYSVGVGGAGSTGISVAGDGGSGLIEITVYYS